MQNLKIDNDGYFTVCDVIKAFQLHVKKNKKYKNITPIK